VTASRAPGLDELDLKLGFTTTSAKRLVNESAASSDSEEMPSTASRGRSTAPADASLDNFERVLDESKALGGSTGGYGKVSFNLPHVGTSPSKVVYITVPVLW